MRPTPSPRRRFSIVPAASPGPYLASNGQLIDRLNSLSNSQIDIKVYVLEVDKTAQSNLGLSLQSATFTPAIGPQTTRSAAVVPGRRTASRSRDRGLGFTVQPFFRTHDARADANLLMQEGHAKVLSSPNLVTSPGTKATFLVGGEIPVVTSTGLGAVNVQYQPYGVQLNVTPEILGNGSVHAVVAPEISRLDYANAVIVSGFTIPALLVSKLSTDVITRPGESIILGGLVNRLEMKTISRIPLLSSIPILGKLFTSTAYQNQQIRRRLRHDSGDRNAMNAPRERGQVLPLIARLPRGPDGLRRHRASTSAIGSTGSKRSRSRPTPPHPAVPSAREGRAARIRPRPKRPRPPMRRSTALRPERTSPWRRTSALERAIRKQRLRGRRDPITSTTSRASSQSSSALPAYERDDACRGGCRIDRSAAASIF